MRTITATMPAWLTNNYTTPDELEKGDPARVIGTLSYFPKNVCPESWVQVGTAKIEVTLISREELIDHKADQLRAEIQKTQADAAVKVNMLTEKLNSLLAITYKPEGETK